LPYFDGKIFDHSELKENIRIDRSCYSNCRQPDMAVKAKYLHHSKAYTA